MSGGKLSGADFRGWGFIRGQILCPKIRAAVRQGAEQPPTIRSAAEVVSGEAAEMRQRGHRDLGSGVLAATSAAACSKPYAKKRMQFTVLKSRGGTGHSEAVSAQP